MWLSRTAVCPTLHLVLCILHSPMKLRSTLKDTFMYNSSRQNFPYLGNRLAAIHQGCSQRMGPVFLCRSKGKLIEGPETREQLSEESCDDNSSLPTRQPPAFPGWGSFPLILALLIQLLLFPQTSGSLLQSQSGHNHHWNHHQGELTDGFQLLVPRWPLSPLRSAVAIAWRKSPCFDYRSQAGSQPKWHPASKVVDLLIAFHTAVMEDPTAQGGCFRSKRSV